MKNLTKLEDTELYRAYKMREDANEKVEEAYRKARELKKELQCDLLSKNVERLKQERIDYLISLREEISEQKRNVIEKKKKELLEIFEKKMQKRKNAKRSSIYVFLEEDALSDPEVIKKIQELDKELEEIQKESKKICNKLGHEYIFERYGVRTCKCCRKEIEWELDYL